MAVRKTRRTQEERSTETRRRVLDATIDCLWRYGYSRTTTTLIAEHAGVSRGAQLHHFPTKEELVISAVDHLFSVRIAEFKEAFAKLPPAADRQSAAIDLLWSMFTGSTFYAWLELTVASRTDKHLLEPVAKITERFGDNVVQTFRDLFNVPPERAADYDVIPALVFSLLGGMAVERIVSPKREAENLDHLKKLAKLLLPAVSPTVDGIKSTQST
jgi:AcrR family transcriptional regulator